MKQVRNSLLPFGGSVYDDEIWIPYFVYQKLERVIKRWGILLVFSQSQMCKKMADLWEK